MKKTAWIAFLFFALALFCIACGAKPKETADGTVSGTEDSGDAEDPIGEGETPELGEGDYVLLTQVAQMDDGRLLKLDAYGKKLNENMYGVRKVWVYDGGELIQEISVREAIEKEWEFGDGVLTEDFYDYTECWAPEETMTVLDLNFDGCSDFGLFGWVPNNTIPYYYWQWDKDAGQYRYVGVLQGAEANPETGEVISSYKSGDGGSEYSYDYYQPDEDGNLQLVRHEVNILSQVVENQDMERTIWETWIPQEGAVLRPRELDENDLVLTRREIPIREIGEDNTAACFTEIWELVDGELQLTSREEFSYET